MRKILITSLTLLLLLSSCSHYKTSTNSKEPILKPRKVEGSLSEIINIAYESAKQAFPDEVSNISIEGNTVKILREWFWRGDTLITISIEPKGDNMFVINAESKASWHRLNPSDLNVSKAEVAEFFKSFDLVYKNNTTKEISDHSIENDSSLTVKLNELKKALDSGLIDQDEYKKKRKEIIDAF